MEYFRIKNWEKFQHFIDRKPPWIKLYRDILDDIEWHELDPLSAKILVMMWLIASEDIGNLPPIKELAFRLRIPEKQVNSCVSKLSHWVERSDIAVIPERYHVETLEGEKEGEKETEKRKSSFVLPEGFDPEVWASFEEHRKKLRKPMTDRARVLVVNQCRKCGGNPNELLEQSIMNGWQGVFPLKTPQTTIPDKKPRSRNCPTCDLEGVERVGTTSPDGVRFYCSKHDPDKIPL